MLERDKTIPPDIRALIETLLINTADAARNFNDEINAGEGELARARFFEDPYVHEAIFEFVDAYERHVRWTRPLLFVDLSEPATRVDHGWQP